MNCKVYKISELQSLQYTPTLRLTDTRATFCVEIAKAVGALLAARAVLQITFARLSDQTFADHASTDGFITAFYRLSE